MAGGRAHDYGQPSNHIGVICPQAAVDNPTRWSSSLARKRGAGRVSRRGSFTHLHVHTEYSMLDGAARIGEVVGAAAADGQPALGITDHGNMYGILDFYKECRQQGVKPILGTEAYMAHESRFERPARRGRIDDSGGDAEGGKKLYYHLTLLAESNTGYRNIIQLASRAFMEGYYYKPRVDWDTLSDHAEGLIATTGCLGGHVLQSLVQGDVEGATAKAARLQDIFGKDNLFVELQDHGIPEQHKTNPQLLDLAKRIGAPLLATNDSHYVHREDAVAQDALLCVQTGSLMSDPDRFKFHGDEHYLKSAAEMRSLFGEVPEACDNTLWVAERCDVEIDFGKPQLPNFPLPEGFASDGEYLHHLTFEGARERWGDRLPDEVVERLAYELKVIDDMGFSSYFLIVWDLIAHARRSGIRVGPGRGSAAGCAVAYCLRITDLDPIRYDLLFERFLNPSRISMPDIDMDFDSRFRDEMIRYAAERYGRDHVAQIVTFSTIKARAAVRDAARVLGHPYAVGDRVAKAMPPLIMGRDTPLYACLEPHPKFEDGYKMAGELREMYEADPDTRQVIDVAKGLEGLRRQDGIHAAAVVITKEPLTEYLPIQRKPENGQAPEDAPVVTQYEMHGVEELGLLKMDFLGLRNLDVITDTVRIIRETRGVELDIDNVPLDDEPTYEMLRRGDTIGVFQLEGSPLRALIRSLAPTTFEDVAALVALYRPGPMAANMHNDYADRKNGRKPVAYLHDDAAELLGNTYGLCLTGDTIVHEALTGRPTRLDGVDPAAGFWVQAVDDDLQPVVRQVIHWVDNGERETARLRLVNGRELVGTHDHPVLTEMGWKRLGELTSDDHVAVPHQLVSPSVVGPMKRSQLRILGYLLADGALSTRSAVTFVNSDAVLLDEFAACVHEAYPESWISKSMGPRGVTRLTVGNGKGNGGGPSALLVWLRELGLKFPAGCSPGGPRSEEKWVPAEVFSMPDDDVGWFLASLWDCDGHVAETLAHYRTISRKLAFDVQSLLHRLGFAAAIYHAPYTNPDGRERVAYQVTVYDGARLAATIAPHLAHLGKRDALFAAEPRGGTLDRGTVVTAAKAAWSGTTRALAEETGLPRWHLMPYAREKHPRMHEASVQVLVDALELPDVRRSMGVRWVGVDSVEPAGVQRVYDITVDEAHNFVANGIVVHNCIYQESVMRIAQKFAGYSLAEADNLRKACGKKDRKLIAKERAKFVDGCERTGYGGELGTKWFDIIEPFADYAFNRSHAFGYGYVAYQTAFLKANYPSEYLAALLTSVKNSLEKAAVYLAECRAMGIAVEVADINRSASDFTPVIATDEAGEQSLSITFGLSAVRNVGEGLVSLIVAEREANGPFTDFHDFCQRVDTQVLNKRTVESLIKAGAFDDVGHPRKGLLTVFEQIVDHTLARRRERDMGIMTLFGGDGAPGDGFERTPIPDLEFNKRDRLAFEKEMLGLYVSDHPLLGAEAALARRADAAIDELDTMDDGALKTLGGVVTGLQRKWTRKGDLMAVFTLEDLRSSVEVMVFPRTMTEHGHKLDDDAVVLVKGRVDKRDDAPKLVAQLIDVVEVGDADAEPLRLRVPPQLLSRATVAHLKQVLGDHPGGAPVYLHLGERQVVRLPERWNVDATNGLLGQLRVVLGAGAIVT
jgi:DNA polymerase III subunit alpha